MKLKGLIDEDFINYKKPSMTLLFPHCSFKCDKEYGQPVCQNSSLANSKDIEIDADKLVDRYLSNNISRAIVMQGLEPFDSFEDLFEFVGKFSKKSNDDIVIYTGYKLDEIKEQVDDLHNNITNNKLIIKFGRFIPNSKEKFDDVLGVTLSSDNQYAKVISK